MTLEACPHPERVWVEPPPQTEEEDDAQGIDRNAAYELCLTCGWSRYHWEQGASDWTDAPEVKEWPHVE